MAKHEFFYIRYDGDALKSHRMNVNDLAPAMLAFSELTQAVARVMNYPSGTIKVDVGVFREGSFVIEFQVVQTLVQQIQGLFTSDTVEALLNAAGLSSLVIGVILFIKKKRGRKADKVEEVTVNNQVEIHFYFGDEIYRLNQIEYKLYKDSQVRKSLEELTKPLENDGIDSVDFSSSNQKQPVSLSKNDVAYFKVGDDAPRFVTESESEKLLILESPVFKEGNKWRFFDGSTTIHAAILDQSFLSRVELGQERFGKGDQLFVVLRERQQTVGTRLQKEFEVIEVKKHLEPLQSQLEV